MKFILLALLFSFISTAEAHTAPPQLHYNALREWFANGAEVHFGDRKGLFVGRCYPHTGNGTENSVLWAHERQNSETPEQNLKLLWTLSTGNCDDCLDTRSTSALKRTLLNRFGEVFSSRTDGQVLKESPLATTLHESNFKMEVRLREYGPFLVELDVYHGPAARVQMRSRTLTLEDGDVAFACYYSIKKP